jgi:O-antigen/teichoic acid export membrane protein
MPSGVHGTAGVSAGAIALGAVTGVLVARRLGPTAVGELVIASIGPVMIGALMICGVDEALLYALARARQVSEAGEVIGSALGVAVALGLLATIVATLLQGFFFVPLATAIGDVPMYVFASLPIMYISTQVMLAIMRAREQYTLWNVCRLSVPAAYLALVLALAATRRLSAGSALMAQYAANVFLCTYLAARLLHEQEIRIVPRRSLGVLRLGIQHHAISLAQLFNQRFDQLLLTRLVSATQLGYYSVAVTYASAPLVVALAPAWHLFSRASRDGNIPPKQFQSSQRVTGVQMAILGLIGAVCAPLVFTLVFGRTFAPAVAPAAILVFGGIPLALSALRAAAWKASGRPLPAAFAEGGGLVVTGVGLGLFAARFGIVAAAWTSIVAYTVVAGLLFAFPRAPVVHAAPSGSTEAPVDVATRDVGVSE